MTRDQAIATINERITSLDDDGVRTLADIALSMTDDSQHPRDLTPRELALVDQSKQDFETGRTLSNSEYHTEMAAFVAELRARFPAAS